MFPLVLSQEAKQNGKLRSIDAENRDKVINHLLLKVIAQSEAVN